MSGSMNSGFMEEKSRHLFVLGLPKDVKDDDVLECFSKFGEIQSVKLQSNASSGTSAVIDFYDVEGAFAAHSADIKLKGVKVCTNFKLSPDNIDKKQEHNRDNTVRENKNRDSSSVCSSTSGCSSSSESDSSSISGTSDTEEDTKAEGAKVGTGKDDGKKILMLKVTNLPERSNQSIYEALYDKFYRCSIKPVIKLYGEVENRYALIKFRSLYESKTALQESQGMIMFGSKLKIATFSKTDFPSGSHDLPYRLPIPAFSQYHSTSLEFSHGNPFIYPGKELDPNATRSLFVGNIPKNISIYDLRDVFQRFGHILDVEIKKMSGNATYGFVLFFNLLSAINAKKAMDGAKIGGNKIRVGYGKGTPSKVLWVDGIDNSLTEKRVESFFSQYGTVVRIGIDRSTYTAMIQFDKVDEAKEALSRVKGEVIDNTQSKIMADFANRDAKAAFFSHLENPEGPHQSYHALPPPSVYSSDPLMRHRPITIIPGLPPPPLDYYPYQYMETDYCQYPTFPVHLHPSSEKGARPCSSGHGDYEDDLREFSKKRERERRKDKEKEETRKSHETSKVHSSSDTEYSQHKQQAEEKIRIKPKRKRKGSTSSRSDSSYKRSELTSVAKSEEKDINKEKSSVSTSKKHSNEDANKTRQLDKAQCKDVTKMKDAGFKNDNKHKDSSLISSEIESNQSNVHVAQKTMREKPKVIITYDEEDEPDMNTSKPMSPPNQTELAVSNVEKQAEILPLLQLSTSLIEPVSDVTVSEEATDAPEKDAKLLEDNESTMLFDSSDTRPKISISWKEKSLKLERLSYLQEQSQLPAMSRKEDDESDFSSCEDFDQLEKDESGLSRKQERPESLVEHKRSSKEGYKKDRKSSKVDSKGEKQTVHSDTSNVTRKRGSHSHRSDSSLPPKSSTSRQRSPVTHQPHSPTSHHTHDPTYENPLHHNSQSPVYQRQKSPASYYSHSPRSPVSCHSHSPVHQHPRSPGPHRLQSPDPRNQRSPLSRLSRSPIPHCQRSPLSQHSRSPIPRRPRSPVSRRPRSPVSRPISRHHHSAMPHPRSPVSRRSCSPVPCRPRSHLSHRSRSPMPRRHVSHRSRSPVPRHPRSPVSRRAIDSKSHHSRSPVSRHPCSPPCVHSRRSRTPIERPLKPISRNVRKSHHIKSHRSNNNSSDRQSTVTLSRHHARRSRSPLETSRCLDHSPSGHGSHVKTSSTVSRRNSVSPTAHQEKPFQQEAKRIDSSRKASSLHPDTPQRSPIPAPPNSSSSIELLKGSPTPPPMCSDAAATDVTALPQNNCISIEFDEGSSQEIFVDHLLYKYPVVWQGNISLKNEAAVLQLHFLSGNNSLPSISLPQGIEENEGVIPTFRISQRIKLEPLQLKGVEKHIERQSDHCLLLGLPCGLDPPDIDKQALALQNIISYLLKKQAAGIINVYTEQGTQVFLHIFPPCQFSQSQLSRVAPDMFSMTLGSCHILIVLAVS